MVLRREQIVPFILASLSLILKKFHQFVLCLYYWFLTNFTSCSNVFSFNVKNPLIVPRLYCWLKTLTYLSQSRTKYFAKNVKMSSKIRQYQNNWVSGFAQYYIACAKKLSLEEEEWVGFFGRIFVLNTKFSFSLLRIKPALKEKYHDKSSSQTLHTYTFFTFLYSLNTNAVMVLGSTLSPT